MDWNFFTSCNIPLYVFPFMLFTSFRSFIMILNAGLLSFSFFRWFLLLYNGTFGHYMYGGVGSLLGRTLNFSHGSHTLMTVTVGSLGIQKWVHMDM
jgi:hypothetical protein